MRREVLDFLLDHQGWIKKSPTDLQRRLSNLGIETSIDNVRTYQAEARIIIKESTVEVTEPETEMDITNGMKVKKV